MRTLALLIFIISWSSISAQPNCQAFLYYGDTLKYEACIKAEDAGGHYQFSKEYQYSLDLSLALDSTFDYPYWAKSIAYLKSGDFLTWKVLIDKAVDLKPKDHLGYRGWCRYQFFRDYRGAIKDIERLDNIVEYDIGQSQNGTYHLNIAKGLCYKGIGKKDKAIDIIETQIALDEQRGFVGPNDYLHLGVLYLENQDYEKALAVFKKQSNTNKLAENQYYSALALLKLGNIKEYRSSLEIAKILYDQGSRLSDPYSNPMDKIYLSDIEEELKKAATM